MSLFVSCDIRRTDYKTNPGRFLRKHIGILDTRRYRGLWPPTSSSSGGDFGAQRAVEYSTVQYNKVQYSTVQYSTVTGEEDGVRGWITPYSTLCAVSETGAASLVAECGTNILFKKHRKSLF